MEVDIQNLAYQIIEYSFKLQASDIYVLPKADKYQVSLRIHSVQRPLFCLLPSISQKLILYFKYQADMDVGEKRKAQLGSMTFSIADRKIRLRLSTVANYLNDESLVIRLLYSQTKDLKYYANVDRQQLQKLINYKGLHLFCGPVGSGKTTLMYDLLRSLPKTRQIITIEDPVEIEEEQFLQLQVQPKINLTYETLIKLCLRHRPDIVVLGEIRDTNTAKSAVRAALTGHTILATMHADDEQAVKLRLQDLGALKLDIEQTLQSVTYQRILPLQCGYCHGECQPFCPHYQDNFCGFYLTTMKYQHNQKGWNDVLRQAFVKGLISEKIYQQEQKITPK